MKNFNILLVEDCEADIKITQRAFEKGGIGSRFAVARDGEEAAEYIWGREGACKRRPDMILLDINLPKRDGFDFLRKLKADEDLSCVPVVMLTSSRSEQDIERSYRFGACSYIHKPVAFSDFVQTVEAFRRYWGEVSELPPRKCDDC